MESRLDSTQSPPEAGHAAMPPTDVVGPGSVVERYVVLHPADCGCFGDAGRSTVPSTIPATTDDQIWFGMFRIGVWPDYFPGVQFSRADHQSVFADAFVRRHLRA